MIPAAFEYQRPASVDEALRALSDTSGGAKVIAGGQSLLPLLKLRLASADTLIDIGRLAELKAQGPTADGGYEVGALVTYAELIKATSLSWAAEGMEHIGDVQVRNRGTVGGSIAHCDPASDLPAMALALDYSVVLRSQRGERTVPLDGFFEGPFQTGMAPDELLIKIVRGPLPAGAAGAYRKLAQPASGYSIGRNRPADRRCPTPRPPRPTRRHDDSPRLPARAARLGTGRTTARAGRSAAGTIACAPPQERAAKHPSSPRAGTQGFEQGTA